MAPDIGQACNVSIPPQTSGLSEKQTAKGKKQTARAASDFRTVKFLHGFDLLFSFCSLLFAVQKSHRKHQVFSNCHLCRVLFSKSLQARKL
ncbi:MAG: hypothetical protein ACREOI_13315 [bacterium]